MPQSFEVFDLNWQLNQNQLEKLKMGFAADDMDKKWNIYFDHNKLYLHRSWTGSCIYIADVIEQIDGSGVITTVKVNRNKNEYNFSSIEDDSNLIRKIIQFHLFDYEPRVKKINISDERLNVLREVIPVEYQGSDFSFYKTSIADLRLTWSGYPESEYINMDLTSGIESTIQSINATHLQFANVLTSIQGKKMLFVISDELFSTCLGVIEFLQNPPLKEQLIKP